MEILEREAETLAPTGEWASLADAYEHALVILAMNLECQVMEAGENFTVLADPERLPDIRREFALYADEQSASRNRVPPPETPFHPLGLPWLAAWIAALFVVYVWQTQDPSLTERFANSSRGIFSQHEWWRPFTALFLHADPGHLLGNLAIGGIFCAMAARTLGAALAWPLILAGGTIGNALNAWSRFPDAFRSIGASTATFAALGILVGHSAGGAWCSRSARGLSAILVPVVAGLILLSWYGIGGENTDVSAHFRGFFAGAALGSLAALSTKPHGAADSDPPKPIISR